MPVDSILIAFFSRKGNNYVNGDIVNLPVGNTEIVARRLQQLTNGRLFHIESTLPYPEDYSQTTEQAKVELKDGIRPVIKGPLPELAEFTTILLGYPNWWGTMPMAVLTFLEKVDLSGKKLAPFCTHEGSGMGHSEKDLAKICSGAKILPGLAIVGHEAERSDELIDAWLKRTVLE